MVGPQTIGILSFFAGLGFLDLGFERAGYHIGYVNEVEHTYLKSYWYAREKIGISSRVSDPYEGLISITSLLSGMGKAHLDRRMRQMQRHYDVVGFIGGPPCPDFSIGGRNAGRDGKNGRLSETYIELILDKQPDFFVFENVKGLVSTVRHRQFLSELEAKVEAKGYKTYVHTINAMDFGVPQDRGRVIFLGFKYGLLLEMGYSVGSSLVDVFPWRLHTRYDYQTVKKLPWPISDEFVPGGSRLRPDGILEAVTVEHWFRQNGVSVHPNSSLYFKPRAGLARFSSIAEGDVSRKSFKRLHRWRFSPTACYGNNEVHLHPYRERRISVAEALALQSLPPEFELPGDITLTDAFKMVGNGVPYLASYGLAKAILSFLGR